MDIKAPQSPTVVGDNPQNDKYIISFASELTDYIRTERKVKTYRYGDKYAHLEKEDEVTLTEYGENEVISKAKITGKEIMLFSNIPLNLDGHEIYDTREHMRKVFSSYYKYIGREIRDDDPFLVFTFKLIK